MFKKFTIILIAILFIWNICLTVKKNKEKFAQSISQQNLQAINNLGTLASQIISNGNKLLTIDDLQIKVGGTPTKLSDWIVSKNSAIQGKLDSIDSAIATNLTNSNSTLKTEIAKSNSTLETAIANNLTNSTSPLKVLEKNFDYFKKLMRNHTHEFSYGGSGGSGGIIMGGGSSSSSPVVKNKKPIVLLNRQGHGGSCYYAAIKLWDEGAGNMYDEFYKVYDKKNFAFNNDQNSNMIGSSGRLCKIGEDRVDLSNYYSS